MHAGFVDDERWEDELGRNNKTTREADACLDPKVCGTNPPITGFTNSLGENKTSKFFQRQAEKKLRKMRIEKKIFSQKINK